MKESEKRTVTCSFRMSPREKVLFDQRMLKSGLNKTEFIIASCLEQTGTRKEIIGKNCAILREIDILENKIRTGEIIDINDIKPLRKLVRNLWK